MTKKRQNIWSVTASTRLRLSQTSACRTRDASSTAQQSKRLRQEERDMGPQAPKCVGPIEIADESARTVHQTNIESIAVGLSKATHSQHEDENVKRQ